VAISASLAPDIGGKERKYMTNNANYTDAPAEIEQALESAMTIDDVLPSPSELVRKTEKEKITIAIDKNSLELFKKYANKHNAKYQTMINGVLSSYADKFLSHK
jgi:predicted DNA binding CopG/RHH family protein